MQSTRHDRDSRRSLEAHQLNYHDSDRDVNSASFGRSQVQTWESPIQRNVGAASPAQQTPPDLFYSHLGSSMQPPPIPSQSISNSFFYEGHRGTVPEWLKACSPTPDNHDPAPSTYTHARTPSPPPPIPGAFNRNHIQAWQESQISGSFRRSEIDMLVSQSDYVPVTRRRSTTSGPSSRESGNSFSSGGASGSALSHREVVSRCEFCGREDLLSALKDHWLRCPRRNARPSSRPGTWFGGSRSVCPYYIPIVHSLMKYSAVAPLRHAVIFVSKAVTSPFDFVPCSTPPNRGTTQNNCSYLSLAE